MSDHKPITGELRKYATVSWDPWPDARDRLYQMCDAIDAIHEGLERENAELRAARGDDWIKLPVDADGVPWRVGDEIVDDGIVCEVVGIGPNRLYYYVDATDTVEWTQADGRRHYHAPTVEDVTTYVVQLQAENAKLRELVLCLLTCSSDTGDACDRCPVNGGAGIWDFEDFCDSLLDRVHELRIELNA